MKEAVEKSDFTIMSPWFGGVLYRWQPSLTVRSTLPSALESVMIGDIRNESLL